ncbi:chemotaxis protein CheA [Steroidobacter sp.]|uniref:chemotaxis protein CheA n=1 Tax=Steroidobacter sp. TaxID=1978227 RepID=UPI001A3FFD51|nr:chemotaxis protein CheA [Steroidobacter sp.]MBL8270369.1 chemotaxis protein CheA [Steroidobacter sp.]
MSHEALPTFLQEARELSEEVETALLLCERGEGDADTINALFRAMHTIKGSAGLFGLDNIVAFAHVVETVLDRVRNGQQPMTPALVQVLIGCRDHINVLLEAVGGDERVDAPTLSAAGEQLLNRLESIAGSVNRFGTRAAPAATAKATSPSVDQDGQRVGSDCWHLSLRFKAEVLRNGMDPMASLSFLNTFAQIVAIETLDDALPALNEFDPEVCYLGFELRLRTDADRERIEGAFEFVREDCTMTLLPPRSRIADYVRLVKELPESGDRLGEILVRCGSLTDYELAQALRQQSVDAAADGAARPLGEILIEQRTVAPSVVEAAVEKQRQADGKGREQRSVRVDADKLENLINLVGELVIAGAATNLLAQRAKLTELNESSQRLARLVEEVRDQTLQLRMMQIGGTFARFARVVRDVAHELGKDIRLETSGADTELDKTLIEKIVDPLTHLVRNSMDHGIEPSDVRVARGKKAQGVVRLNAHHDSGSVVIEVSDDGGGLRREKILNKALERGLIAAGQQLTDSQVYALIFEPGFSTADAVTNLSGRGVGMDVVKRNVMALRGTVDIDSKEGEGTTVRIRLPLTLAIIEGFLVRVGQSSFVIPLEMVEECVESTLATNLLDSSHRYIDLRGQVLPFVRLRDHFGIAGKSGRRESIVVVRCGNLRAGFVVDELLGEHQTVIKPLARVFQHVRGLGGSSILADGGIALIIDAPALIEQCQQASQPRAAADVA